MARTPDGPVIARLLCRLPLIVPRAGSQTEQDILMICQVAVNAVELLLALGINGDRVRHKTSLSAGRFANGAFVNVVSMRSYNPDHCIAEPRLVPAHYLDRKAARKLQQLLIFGQVVTHSNRPRPGDALCISSGITGTDPDLALGFVSPRGSFEPQLYAISGSLP